MLQRATFWDVSGRSSRNLFFIISQTRALFICFCRFENGAWTVSHCKLPNVCSSHCLIIFTLATKRKDYHTSYNWTYWSFTHTTIPSVIFSPKNLRSKYVVIGSVWFVANCCSHHNNNIFLLWVFWKQIKLTQIIGTTECIFALTKLLPRKALYIVNFTS